MLRMSLLALGVAVMLAATATPTHAIAPEPSEKCDDLQNRCLHRENGICVIWHDECLVKKPVGHGPKRSRRRLGSHRHHA